MSRKPKGLADLESLEKVFAALAHRSRRSILLVLRVRGGAMTSKEIADRFDAAWPTITRHLGVLEDARLVQVEARGRERLYRLDAARLVDVAGGWIERFRAPRPGSSAIQSATPTAGGRRPPSRVPTPRQPPTRYERPTRQPGPKPRR